MSQYSNTMTLTGTVFNPYAIKYTDGSLNGVNATYGTGGEQLITPIRGKYATANIRGQVYTASIAAVALCLNTAATQLFAILNPAGSGVAVEMIRCDAAYVVATTVVNGLGVYFSSVAATGASTFTTAITVQNGQLGGPTGKATAWSAVTKSGTPLLQALVGGWGAVTNGGLGLIRYDFDGTVIIPPGVVAYLATTTATATASGLTASLTWMEYTGP
jgi:hypothetical protein